MKTICELFHRVDRAGKAVEEMYGEFPEPVLNEIRMAFSHVIMAHDGTGNPEKEMEQAHLHCKRAYYDVREIEVLSALEIIKDFERECSGHEDVVKAHVEGYANKRHTVLEAQNTIKNALTNPVPRDKRYEQFDIHCETLREYCKEITAMQPAISTAIRKQKIKSFCHYVGVAAGFMTAVAVVVGLIVNWLRS